MKICLMCEGSYPYVTGGVSSWVHMLINSMKDIEFCISAIVVDRQHGGKFKYNFPSNLTEIHEIYLQDSDFVKMDKKYRLSKIQREAFHSFVMGKDTDWETIFEFFAQEDISVNSLIMGTELYDIIKEYYQSHYERLPFTDFLWTYRSMFLPICLLLKNKLPYADLYHTASAGYSGILASMAKALYGKPMLMTEHGIYTREREEDIIRSPEFNGLYKDMWIEHFYKLSECAYEHADKVISLFEGARSLQIELGCSPEKTLVIPNGVEPAFFDGAPKKDENDKEINLGLIARIATIKDIKTLINSYAAAQERVPNITLYIMGSPEEDSIPYYEECQDLVESLGLKKVIFTGNINVYDYIKKMDMIILTSISEGQPMVLLEAMSAERACIATRVGCCEELLWGKTADEEQCGLITPIMSVGQISNAIVELARDAEKRKQFGAVGRQRIETDYRKDDVIRRYRQLYQNMVDAYQVM